jgi:hypothetical protein
MHEVHIKRQTNPQLFSAVKLALAQHEQALREVAKLIDVSPRDLRTALAIAWPNRSRSMVGL